MKFVLATHNPGKLKEMGEILSGLGVEVVSPADVGITVDVEETGTTFAENAMLKAKAICAASGLPAIADDSGLCVDALNGGPGVYSARYGGEGLDDRGRYTLLLHSMPRHTTRPPAQGAGALPCGRKRQKATGTDTRRPTGCGRKRQEAAKSDRKRQGPPTAAVLRPRRKAGGNGQRIPLTGGAKRGTMGACSSTRTHT